MSYVQSKSSDAGSVAASTTLAYTNAVGAGNWLMAAIRIGTTSDIVTSVSDNVNAGNWTNKISQPETGGVNRLYVFIKENTSAGTPTVTVNVSSTTTVRWAIAEYGNIVSSNTIDTALSQDNSSSTTTPSTPTATTANSNCTIITVLSNSNNVVNTITDNGYTSRVKLVASSSDVILSLSDIDVTATGSYAETYTLGLSDTTASAILAVKSPGGGGGSTSQQAGGQSIFRLQGPLWR